MAEHGHQLVAIAKTLLDAATSLLQHATDVVAALADALPPGEEPADLSANVSEDTTDTTRMTAQLAWDNTGQGNVTIDWGATDATDDEEPETGTATYRYQSAGTYVIKVTDLDDDARYVRIPVTIPFSTTTA